MPRNYFPAKDFDSLFLIDAPQTTGAARVKETLSGQAQVLKSAEHSLTYKNFNGEAIEETTLVGELHQQNIDTDWVEEYAAGMTTNFTEIAPSFNQQLFLKTTHSRIHQNLNESVNTQNEAHSINVTQWNTFHHSIHTEISSNLQQTFAESDSATVDQWHSQIGAQNIQSETYRQDFNALTLNSSLNLEGNSIDFAGQNIIIGS